MVKQAPPITLPPDYYIDHYRYLLNFVENHYSAILLPIEKQFIATFNSLSHPAQCLYVRFINRRIKYFNIAQLNYTEIENIYCAADELITTGLAQWLTPDSAIEFSALTQCFTKNELIEFAKNRNLIIPKKSTKTEVCTQIKNHIPLRTLVEIITVKTPLMTPLYSFENQMLQFFFFGNLDTDLKQFVVRDIGYIKLQDYEPTGFSPHFLTREEAEDSFNIELGYQTFKSLQNCYEPLQLYRWFKDWYQAKYPSAHPKLAKLILKVAKCLEQHHFYEQALSCYRLTLQAPSMERQVRLLKKLHRTDEAITICQMILASKTTAKEAYFAKDFLQKLEAPRIRLSTTAYLDNAELIDLSKTSTLKPEQAVMEYLKQQGYQVLYTENYIWRSLFGLLFWDIVFDPKLNTINNPLQIAPSDLYTGEFFTLREKAFNNRIKLLNDKQACLKWLNAMYTAKQGIHNPMVSWHESLWFSINLYYNYISCEHLAAVLLEMARDWCDNSCGFPDLFCWDANAYQFIEVKSPTDQLSAQQLKWLVFFNDINLPAKVIRIHWTD